MEHASHLERAFGCGPHTVSVPRIEPAEGAPNAADIPSKVSDNDFKKIVAIIRIALPYTGIILSTRENDAMRTELIHYGISQVSAGSRTNPGSYAHEEDQTGSQFSLGDHRTLDQMISSLADEGFIPSFSQDATAKEESDRISWTLPNLVLSNNIVCQMRSSPLKNILKTLHLLKPKQKGLH